MLDKLLELDKNLELVTLAETDLINGLEKIGFYNLPKLIKDRVSTEEHDDLTYEIDSLNDSLNEANERIDELESQLNDANEELVQAQNEIKRLKRIDNLKSDTNSEYIQTVVINEIRAKIADNRGKTALKKFDRLPNAVKDGFALYLSENLGIDFAKYYGKYLFEGIDKDTVTIKVKY